MNNYPNYVSTENFMCVDEQLPQLCIYRKHYVLDINNHPNYVSTSGSLGAPIELVHSPPLLLLVIEVKTRIVLKPSTYFNATVIYFFI